MSGSLAAALGLPDRRAITISDRYDPMDGPILPTAEEEIGGFFDNAIEFFTGQATTSSGERLTVEQTERKNAAEAQALDEKNAVALAKIADTRPEVVDAAMAAINLTDPTGKIGITTADRKEVKRRAAKARFDLAKNDAAIKQAEAELDAAGKDAAKNSSRRGAVALLRQEDKRELEDYRRLKENPPAKDDVGATQQHAEQMAELAKVIRARREGIKQMEIKIERSETAHAAAVQKVAPYEKMKQDLKNAQADFKVMEAKAAIIGAVIYGPLSEETPPDLDAVQQKALMEVCGKNTTLGVAAIEAVRKGGDVAAVVKCAGKIADRLKDGFKGPEGKAPDLPPDQMLRMAEQAIAMTAQKGEAWFDGFAAYLDTGGHLKEDPDGGSAAPLEDSTREARRKKDVAAKRSKRMAAAALNSSGVVDFSEDNTDAKAALADLEYHPSCLLTPTPILNAQVQSVVGLFTKEDTARDAALIMQAATAPANKVAGDIVGKDSDGAEGTQKGVREAVLAAMMTPMTQGPVGSCFATAPARKQQLEAPLDYMRALTKIASEGTFAVRGQPDIPAAPAETIPSGENALMRSMEYSLATASANVANAAPKKDMSIALSQHDTFDGLESGAVGTMLWKGRPDDLTGGLRPRLLAAIRSELVLRYDAVKPTSGPSTDGSSSQGGFQLYHGTKVIKNEGEFVDALVTIALKAAEAEIARQAAMDPIPENDPRIRGFAPGSDIPLDWIEDFIREVSFIKSIKRQYADADKRLPWDPPSGGLAINVYTAMEGQEYERRKPPVLTETAAADDSRCTALVNTILTNFGSDNAFSTVVTNGDSANHGFNIVADNDAFKRFAAEPGLVASEITGPGKEIAAKKLSVEKAAALYQKAISNALAPFGSLQDYFEFQAQDHVPDKTMTPAELQTHIKAQTEEILKAQREAFAKGKAEDFVAKYAKENSGAEPPADKLDAEKAKAEATFRDLIDEQSAVVLREGVPTPAIVLGDTNWGDPDSQVMFIAAVDPVTGEMRLMKEDKVTGKRLEADSFAKARWQKIVKK